MSPVIRYNYKYMHNRINLTLGFVLATLVVLAAFLYIQTSNVGASVISGNEYYYELVTSDDASSTAITQLRSGHGSLGSLVISSSSAPTSYPTITIYDATSTQATSTATVIAQFGINNQTHGTYVFDAIYTTGLSIEVPAGFDGVYTVTYR